MRRILLACIAVISGCTSVTVKPVDPSLGIAYVCIRDNPKVQVDDFIPVVRDGFDKHGIATEVFYSQPPSKCEYILTYTALRSWDLSSYLSHAELRLEKDGRKVASAEYHLNGKGGFSLMKWQSTKSKMEPVIDELLAGSPR